MRRAQDIKGVVKKQKMYSTLARREGKDALKAEAKEKREGAPEMAADSAREAKVSFKFAKARKKIATLEQKKLKQTRKKK
ncbi:MAG: hypothetical protein ABSA33_01820 [Candidatus Micrarchaeaceae archaeon]|jgi:hypothetical protein